MARHGMYLCGRQGYLPDEKSPIRLPEPHAILKAKSYLPFHPLVGNAPSFSIKSLLLTV